MLAAVFGDSPPSTPVVPVIPALQPVHTATADTASMGAALFEANCYPCHGMRGFGDGPAATVVKAPPRDFSRAVFKFGTTRGFPSDDDLF